MKFWVVASKKDEAGLNIIRKLHEEGFKNYQVVEQELIHAEHFDAELDIKGFVVFASKHASKETRKTLSIHAPGNWHAAEMGGQEGKICKTSALFMKLLFDELAKKVKALPGYELTLECTHHGPLIEQPCCFVEIGSTLQEWRDEKAAKIVAASIIAAIKKYESYKNKQQVKAVIGVGGPHYCPRFTRLEKEGYAFSYVIPAYALPLSKEMLQQAISRCIEPFDKVIIDWKGLKGEERKQVVEMLASLGVAWARADKL